MSCNYAIFTGLTISLYISLYKLEQPLPLFIRFDIKTEATIVQRRENWDDLRTKNAIISYDQFIQTIAYKHSQNITEPTVPGHDADMIWHEHILNTKKYRTDMISFLGFLPIHSPTKLSDARTVPSDSCECRCRESDNSDNMVDRAQLRHDLLKLYPETIVDLSLDEYELMLQCIRDTPNNCSHINVKFADIAWSRHVLYMSDYSRMSFKYFGYFLDH